MLYFPPILGLFMANVCPIGQVINEFGTFDDIIQKGVAQAQGASVCILHSETDDVWFQGLEFGPAAKRSLYKLRPIYMSHMGPKHVQIERVG
jgi:hypothetical protein